MLECMRHLKDTGHVIAASHLDEGAQSLEDVVGEVLGRGGEGGAPMHSDSEEGMAGEGDGGSAPMKLALVFGNEVSGGVHA